MPLDQPRHQHLIGVAIIDLHLILAPRAYLGLITHSQDTPPLHGHVSGLGLGGIHGNNFLSRKNGNWFVLSARHELGILSWIKFLFTVLPSNISHRPSITEHRLPITDYGLRIIGRIDETGLILQENGDFTHFGLYKVSCHLVAGFYLSELGSFNPAQILRGGTASGKATALGRLDGARRIPLQA